MISVTERERAVEGPAPGEARVEPDTQAHHPPMRRGSRDQEPLVVEIAWLIIEGAVIFQRLCQAQEL
jgi:hypothetical protein